MFSVVFTEVLQFSIMTVACISVGIIAMQRGQRPTCSNQFIPGGWRSPWFGRTLDLDWIGADAGGEHAHRRTTAGPSSRRSSG